MPISYIYDPESNTINTVAFGVLTANDLLDYLGDILDDGRIKSGFIEIADFEAVNDLNISYSEIHPFQPIWKQYLAKGCLATIVYSPNDACYGISRMIQTVIQMKTAPDPGTFVVVRTRDELMKTIEEIRNPSEK